MPNAARNPHRRGTIRRRVAVAGLALSAVALLSAAASPSLFSADSPVADAAMRRDSIKVKQLLKEGADVNAAQGDGMTALHWAATHGDAAEARMLVYAGARLEAATRNANYTPLHLAARAGNASVVKALLEAGANVSATTSSGGATALHLAAAQGSTDVIIALLDHGAKVDARESAWGQTPLMWAADFNRVKAIEILIARGADIRATSKVEDIPARERADRAVATLRGRRVAALKAAEQPQPASGARGGPPPQTALVAGGRGAPPPAAGAAVTRDSTKSGAPAGAKPAEMPRAFGDTAAAKASAPSARGEPVIGGTKEQTPVSGRPAPADSQRAAAAQERSLSYSDLVGNKGGLTPLLFAVRQGNVESVRSLLAAGADIGEVSQGDHTSALLMATINGQFDIAKLLLDRGASPNQASDAGTAPLYATINVQWAAKSLYPQPTAQKQQQTTALALMEALLRAGADPNARLKKHLWFMSYNFDLLGVNTAGATPFWRAAYGLDIPAMRLLVAYGADPKIPTTKPAGRQRGDDAPVEDDAVAKDPSGLAPIPAGGPGVYPIHAASGVGYGEGYAANAHMHAPDAWLPAVKYLVEELGADVNARDFNGYSPLHHAAARGDNQLIEYLVSKGADVSVVSRKGQTTADMANGPVQRISPFLDTVALLEKLGSKNNHKCKSC
jgi:ankyrin repeat protein